jgi:hypothetical protein
MAASKHIGIRDACAALLAAAPAISPGGVLENRELPLPNGVESQVHVFRVVSPPERGAVQGAPIDWSTQVRIVVKARKGADTAERIADSIATEVYARLMADQVLGGLAMGADPGAFVWDQDEIDPDVAMVTWDITYLHRTEHSSIS